RWTSSSRAEMFAQCAKLLSPRMIGPNGEWAKLAPGLEELWQRAVAAPTTIADLAVEEETEFSLTVATTPRYYISASLRPLNRTSKVVLNFSTQIDQQWAAIILNSSLPYVWWRALDGGVSLPRRVLMSLPLLPLPP